MPKKTNPEITITDAGLIRKVIELIKKDRVLTKAESSVSELKNYVSDSCRKVWDEEANKGNFLGLERVVTSEGNVRCEQKLPAKKGTQSISIEQQLKNLFGAVFSLLWHKKRVITSVNDPRKVQADLGDDLFEYFDLVPKKGQDETIVSKTMAISYEDVLEPDKKFLIQVKENEASLTAPAKKFLKKYLSEALDYCVVLGTRGTSKS